MRAIANADFKTRTKQILASNISQTNSTAMKEAGLVLLIKTSRPTLQIIESTNDATGFIEGRVTDNVQVVELWLTANYRIR